MRRVAALTLALVSAAHVVGCRSEEVAGDGAEVDFDLRAKVLGHEELIAGCMAEAGFEYVAVMPGDLLLEEARAEAQANGEDLEAAIDSVELPPDPNDQIVDSLSAADKAAYASAFWGVTDVDGCYYETYEDAWGVDIVEMAEGFNDNLSGIEDRIAADPRVIEAKAGLIECVSSEGYDVSSYYDVVSFEAKAESEAVDRVMATGAEDIVAGDPIWMAYEEEISVFRVVYDRCSTSYTDTVAPIENGYLGHD